MTLLLSFNWPLVLSLPSFLLLLYSLAGDMPGRGEHGAYLTEWHASQVTWCDVWLVGDREKRGHPAILKCFIKGGGAQF